jgi:quinol monooxygenase YgiN
VSGTFRVPPENVDRFVPHMEEMIEASRNEIGCGQFNYVEQPDELGRFHVIELWDSSAALERHMASEHRARWRSTWPTFGVGSAQLQKYTLRASMDSVAAVATVEPCRTITVVLNDELNGVSVHCLAHRTVRRYRTLPTAKTGALRPAEWCERCTAALAPPPSTTLQKWALVLMFFDASGVPDDVVDVPPPRPRRRRRPPLG